MGLGVELVWQWSGSKVIEVAQFYFECRLFPSQACLIESPVLERKSEGKIIGIGKFPMVLLFMHLVQRNGAKESCRICSFSVSLKEKL